MISRIVAGIAMSLGSPVSGAEQQQGRAQPAPSRPRLPAQGAPRLPVPPRMKNPVVSPDIMREVEEARRRMRSEMLRASGGEVRPLAGQITKAQIHENNLAAERVVAAHRLTSTPSGSTLTPFRTTGIRSVNDGHPQMLKKFTPGGFYTILGRGFGIGGTVALEHPALGGSVPLRVKFWSHDMVEAIIPEDLKGVLDTERPVLRLTPINQPALTYTGMPFYAAREIKPIIIKHHDRSPHNMQSFIDVADSTTTGEISSTRELGFGSYNADDKCYGPTGYDRFFFVLGPGFQYHRLSFNHPGIINEYNKGKKIRSTFLGKYRAAAKIYQPPFALIVDWGVQRVRRDKSMSNNGWVECYTRYRIAGFAIGPAGFKSDGSRE